MKFGVSHHDDPRAEHPTDLEAGFEQAAGESELGGTGEDQAGAIIEGMRSSLAGSSNGYAN